jgi:hypothetical protein
MGCSRTTPCQENHGDVRFLLYSVAQLVRWHRGMTEVSGATTSVSKFITLRRKSRGFSYDFQALLQNFCGPECEDPRDKVYALLGLLGNVGLIPDYNKTVDEVFSDAAKFAYQAEIGHPSNWGRTSLLAQELIGWTLATLRKKMGASNHKRHVPYGAWYVAHVRILSNWRK